MKQARAPTSARRRATDAMKMGCPFCGGSESFVLKSRGMLVRDQIRRRRQCADCGKRFPTSETVDVALMVQEAARKPAA